MRRCSAGTSEGSLRLPASPPLPPTPRRCRWLLKWVQVQYWLGWFILPLEAAAGLGHRVYLAPMSESPAWELIPAAALPPAPQQDQGRGVGWVLGHQLQVIPGYTQSWRDVVLQAGSQGGRCSSPNRSATSPAPAPRGALFDIPNLYNNCPAK